MCGINGIFNYARIAIGDEESLIDKMNRALSHRGPDDSGKWLNRSAGIYFGHTRLSILDLSPRGHQPMVTPRGTVVTYNGEMYNFQELKTGIQGHSFFTKTDTEVLLCLYEQQGHGCLNKLNGMFAFGIWDEQKRELFLARDRIGIKPLYYTNQKGIFAFSSEIKALLTLPWIKAELDEEALDHFLTHNKLFPPKTMFKDIHKFHPGHMMTLGEKGIEIYEPYWEVSYSDLGSDTSNQLEEQTLQNLTSSVRYRMVSDVPVGAFLSGGVDSSAVATLMAQHASGPIKTYSIGFQDAPGYDELGYARKISKRLGTVHFEKIVTPQELLEFLPKIVDIFDEPLADATSIPIYFLSELARQNNTIVVLTGDGSDELFCGYRKWMRYVQLYPYYGLFFRLPAFLKSCAANIVSSISGDSPIEDIMTCAAKGQFFLGGKAGFKDSMKYSCLSRDFLQRNNMNGSCNGLLHYRRLFESVPKNGRKSAYLDWLCFAGLKTAIPNLYLYRADHLGMAHSVELRVPFLDHRLVNFALSIPSEWKLRHSEPKYILKHSLEQLLPAEILYRKKQGFCVPLREWMGDHLLGYVQQKLRGFCSDTGIFREEVLRAYMDEANRGNSNFSFPLWNIYFLMTWFYRWLL